MRFALNFIGINIQKRAPSLHYYADTLRMPMEHDTLDRTIIVPKTSGMRVEMFAPRSRSKHFNHSVPAQSLRPCIHARNLSEIAASLEKTHAVFGATLDKTGKIHHIEVTSPDRIVWLVVKGRGYPAGDGLKKPHIGSAELQTRAVEDQVQFYSGILGLHDAGMREEQRILRDRKAKTFLRLVDARGAQSKTSQIPHPAQPVFLSFECSNAKRAEEMLRSRGVTILQPAETHYYGTDLLILDPEKNIVQIVQYSE